MSGHSLSKRFGAEIRRHRLSQSLSQEALADIAGIHATYLSMVERGVRNPTLEVAERIAISLKSPLSELIEKAEGKPSHS